MNTKQTQTAPYAGTDRLLLGIVLAVMTYTLFAQTALNVAPAMRSDLGIDIASSNLAVSLTALFSGLFIVVMGGLSDKLGRIRITRLGLILSIIGSGLIALSPSGTAWVLIAGRIIQGLSAACIMPSTLALIKGYFQGAARQRAVSLFSMGAWGGTGLSSLFGGLVASSIGWRWIFGISIIIAALSLALIQGTPESRNVAPAVKKRFDLPGMATFMIAMVALNLLIGQGASQGWLSPFTLGMMLLTAAGLAAFIRIEQTGSERFIDFGLFRSPLYRGATLSNFLLNSAAGTLMVTLSLVQTAADLSSFQAGLLTAGYLVAILVTIRIGERLLQKWGPRKPMLLGSAITSAGILLLTTTFLLTRQYMVTASIGFTLFGIGLGLYATPSTDTALSSVPNELAGAASGIYKMSSSLGAAFGVAISAALFTGLSNGQVRFMEGLFRGRTDNIAIRYAAAIALFFNLFMVLLAIISILATIPSRTDGQKALRK